MILETIIFAVVSGLVGIHFPQPIYARRVQEWMGAWVTERFGKGIWIGVKSLLWKK